MSRPISEKGHSQEYAEKRMRESPFRSITLRGTGKAAVANKESAVNKTRDSASSAGSGSSQTGS